MSNHNNDEDEEFRKALQEFAEWLMEMEQKGYIERVGNQLDEWGFPQYKLTKKAIGKFYDFQLRFSGRNN